MATKSPAAWPYPPTSTPSLCFPLLSFLSSPHRAEEEAWGGAGGAFESFCFAASSSVSYGCCLCLAHRVNATSEGSDMSNFLDLLEHSADFFPPESK